jgi:flagellar hook-length control protein FliK
LAALSVGLSGGSDVVPALLGQVVALASAAIEPGRERGGALGERRRPGLASMTGAEFLVRTSSGASISGLEPAVNSAAPDRSRFAAAITAQIQASEVREGRTVVELSPRGLGQVEVDIRTEADGSLKVTIRADNPSVLNALRDARDLLAQSIGAAGGGVLDFQEKPMGQEQGGQGTASVPEFTSRDEGSASAIDPVPHSEVIGGGQLDITT